MMFVNISAVTIYVRPGVTDMRKAINGLSMIASEQMEADPLSGSLFLFCNRYRRILKCLYWDRNGFCLWHKRLERDRFPSSAERGTDQRDQRRAVEDVA